MVSDAKRMGDVMDREWKLAQGSDDHAGKNGRWESTSIPLQWGDPQPLLEIPGTPQVGKNFFQDETCPVRGFVSVDPVSLV